MLVQLFEFVRITIDNLWYNSVLSDRIHTHLFLRECLQFVSLLQNN